MSTLYAKAKHTFHVLMLQLGQMQTYEYIMELYGGDCNKTPEEMSALRDVTIKLLVRCMYGYDSVEQIRIIFKM